MKRLARKLEVPEGKTYAQVPNDNPMRPFRGTIYVAGERGLLRAAKRMDKEGVPLSVIYERLVRLVIWARMREREQRAAEDSSPGNNSASVPDHAGSDGEVRVPSEGQGQSSGQEAHASMGVLATGDKGDGSVRP